MPDEIKVLPLGSTFEDVFDGIAAEALDILYARQRKYGPENIRQLGLFGVFDRLASDKVERVRKAFNGRLVAGRLELDPFEDFGDESFEDALFDISNYALIMIAVRRNLWGKPLRADTGELIALAGGSVRQLREDGATFTGFPDGVDEFGNSQESNADTKFGDWLMGENKDEPHAFSAYSPASLLCNVDQCGRAPEDDIHVRPEEPADIGKIVGFPEDVTPEEMGEPI